MKIFSKEQLAQIDKQTRYLEPIPEIDLMERASVALTDWISGRYPPSTSIAVFAGPGNNGGDALAVARLLASAGFSICVYLPELGARRSEASLINLERIRMETDITLVELSEAADFPELYDFDLVLDGLYGAGLNRPLTGFACSVIDFVNRSGVEVVAIDLPSGLQCDENVRPVGSIIRATTTLTLGFPKLALLFAENEPFFGKWVVIPFGLSEEAVGEMQPNYQLLESDQAAKILKKRKIFAHKGSFGHGLLLSGSKGKIGAAQLGARGALRAGAGLVTVHLPQSAGSMLQIALPEAMSSFDQGEDCLTELPELKRYSAIAAGPGIGTTKQTQTVIRELVEKVAVPLVLDADALNMLAENPGWIKLLPADTILTPHPAEFDRLSGLVSKTEEERFRIAEQFAASYGIILILKGAFTRIIFPNGNVFFKSTGNPGMATAGSGDVLTGILLGLLCQGYTPREAALLGVFLHGLSADLRVKSTSEESLLSSEIADYLGNAFSALKCR